MGLCTSLSIDRRRPPFTSGGGSQLRDPVPSLLLLLQVEDLKNKNLLLRAQLRHHGVEVVIKSDSS